MGQKCIHLGSTFLLQKFRSSRNSIGRVGQIINKNSRSISYVTNQHHCSVLSIANLRGTTFLNCLVSCSREARTERYTNLVNQGERHSKSICNGRCSLRSSSIRTHNHCLLITGYIVLDIFSQEMSPI